MKYFLKQKCEYSFEDICTFVFIIFLDMLHVLQQTGLYFLSNHFMSSINNEKTNNCNNDYKFECAWRLGDWSLLDSKQTTYGSQPNFNSLNCERNQSYYSYHYEALKCLNDNDEVGVKRALDNARNCVIKYLRNISLGNLCNSSKKIVIVLCFDVQRYHFTYSYLFLQKAVKLCIPC